MIITAYIKIAVYVVLTCMYSKKEFLLCWLSNHTVLLINIMASVFKLILKIYLFPVRCIS